ncbi:MAG: hypothetical protein Fur0044_25900 [Anaerolineae bacterium]
MKKTGLYDTLQIASNFMEQAEKLAKTQDYETAFVMLEKAKSYAFDNQAMLDNIRLRAEALSNARRHYLRQLEEEATRLFQRDPFEAQKAREVLQTLRQQDKQNEIAQSLWAELQAKEAAERERRLVAEFQQELDKIWGQAQALERAGVGSAALAEYERALVETIKKVGETPQVIPLQRLKLIATEKRDRAQKLWVELPALISARQGQALLDFYEALKSQGETETVFFDEQGEFKGYLPLEECLEGAKTLANRFAEQRARAYLEQAQNLLAESPRAAYDKIREGLAAVAPNDAAKQLLEQELKERIEPALAQRDRALTLLTSALDKEEPLESWLALNQVEQVDRFTPGLNEARQQLAAVLEQKLGHLLEKGQQFQDLEEFEMAQLRFEEIINTGQSVATYNDALQTLHSQAQAALERCLQIQQTALAFEQRLAEIAELSQTEPEQAHEALAALKAERTSGQELAKLEHVQVQIDFRLGVERLFHTLEQKMAAVTDPVELIVVEEGAKQAQADYPEEPRFPRLAERIAARRAFLQGSALCEDPEEYVAAMGLLRQVVELQGDDAATAQTLLDKIAANEQQEADIAIALKEADQALAKGDARSAFLLVQPFRYAASRQAAQVQDLISAATTRWRGEIEQQLEALVAAEEFILPKVEFLIQELERAQSPQVNEWRVKALAPAYATTARDLQELDRWDEAERLWEEAFRLSPKTPSIAEGRRQIQKHNTLARAQAATDPAEKERLLSDLDRAANNDPTIKRHLAAFYYNQKRYAEARLALTQAKALLEQMDPLLAETDKQTIQTMEQRIQEAEEIEKGTAAIRNQLKGELTLTQLKETRLAYQALLETLPQQNDRLQRWWDKLIETKVSNLKSDLAKISDKAGTAWSRAELLCQILVLQPDASTQEQARRVLKLAFDHLQPDLKMVAENPEGVGFGVGGEALENHSVKAKALYERLIEMTELERVMAELGLEVVDYKPALNEALYQLELTTGKLYFIQEKRRELKRQIRAALVSGQWDAVEDGLKELELKGWHQHRGVQDLPAEIEKAKRQRSNMEVAVEQVKQAMAQEKFRLVLDRLAYMATADPDDETHLRETLEVVDPYTGQTITGQESLEPLVGAKLAALDKLSIWQEGGQPAINWLIIRSKIAKLANRGDFQAAVELAQAALGQNDDHPALVRDEVWSLERLRQHLDAFPLAEAELNSRYARNLFDEVAQKSQVLTKQINEGAFIIEELRQKEHEVQHIISQLRPLLQRLNERKDFFSSLFSSANDHEEARQQLRELVQRGLQLCPEHPSLLTFQEDFSPKR